MCNVLGIGVADKVKTSTVFLNFLRDSLCLTPNLCSSSITSNPKLGRVISFEIILCVPIRMSTNPFLASFVV